MSTSTQPARCRAPPGCTVPGSNARGALPATPRNARCTACCSAAGVEVAEHCTPRRAGSASGRRYRHRRRARPSRSRRGDACCRAGRRQRTRPAPDRRVRSAAAR
jgi:hypothetical protein